MELFSIQLRVDKPLRASPIARRLWYTLPVNQFHVCLSNFDSQTSGIQVEPSVLYLLSGMFQLGYPCKIRHSHLDLLVVGL